MPIPFKLEYVIEKTMERLSDEKYALKALAGIELSASEAKAAWPRIQDHKWFLSERLGRDVGLRVAIIDYYENIAPAGPAGAM